jgi:hypothetical protein
MNITTFCSPLVNHQALTDSERRERDAFFASLSLEDRVILFEMLDTTFRIISPAEDWQYRMDYLRWYTLLAWQQLRNATPKTVNEIIFPRLLSIAVLFDYDPILELINYIDNNPFDEDTAPLFYSDLQANVLKSPAIIAFQKDQPITLKQLSDQIARLNRRDDSLEWTEFFAYLKGLLFTKNDLGAYSTTDPEEGTSRFIDIIQFLLGVKPDKIFSVVKTTLHADEYEQILAANERAEALSISPESVPSEITEALQPVSPRLTYAEIKNLIEEDLLKNPISDPIALAEDITERLHRLALYYHDETIEQLYYYNEQDSQFYWNADLL